jgi:hypothetical protein
MELRNRLPIRNGHDADLTVVVEPWATELVLKPGRDCEVVAIHHSQWPLLEVEPCSYGLVVTVYGESYELWFNGQNLA